MKEPEHNETRDRYLETFTVQLGLLDGSLNKLHEYSATDFLTWCDQTKSCHQRIVALPRDPKISFKIKRKIIADFKENLTKIILNLQFHDIIAQKIQRVQQILYAIIQDARQLSGSEGFNDQYKYFILFPKLASLNIGLLRYINLEYKRSTGQVERVVLELKENKDVAKQIGLDSFNTTNHANLFESVCLNLSMALEKSSQYWLERFDCAVEVIEEEELQNIRSMFSMESERIIFDSIFNRGKGIDLLYSEMDNEIEDYAEGEVELF